MDTRIPPTLKESQRKRKEENNCAIETASFQTIPTLQREPKHASKFQMLADSSVRARNAIARLLIEGYQESFRRTSEWAPARPDDYSDK
jgi:hypothetical protein